MNQSNIIFAYLVGAFIIFITMRGELRTYIGFIFGGGAPATAPGQPQPASTAAPAPQPQKSSSLDNAAKLAELGMFVFG